MAHYLAGDGKHRGSSHDDNGEVQPRGYQYGRAGGKYGRGHSAKGRANGFLKNLIQVAANAKLRRIQQELELRDIRLDGPDREWIAHSLRKTIGTK